MSLSDAAPGALPVRNIAASLPAPPFPVETPCFVILEEGVLHNLKRTAEKSGGIERLMPHIKTHRAAWIIRMMLDNGVRSFKAATPAEVEIAAGENPELVVWAYPTVNPLAIRRVAETARRHPDVQIEAIVDSQEGTQEWLAELDARPAANVGLRIDLDPGLGRTGVPITRDALALADRIAQAERFRGWHVYDGHIQDPDRTLRERHVADIMERLRDLMVGAAERGLSTDLIAGGSYSFDLWPRDLARWVSPGSFTYSSSQHDRDLADVGWTIAAYVLSTVLSVRGDTATLDAGSKAISPDMPFASRFAGPGPIRLMKEEHVVVETDRLRVGEQVPLVPRHACTAAYLYGRALVRTAAGEWEYRDQLGSSR